MAGTPNWAGRARPGRRGSTRGADAAGGGFYRATLATVEQAWVRPRFAGYPEFQTAASAVLRDGLLAGEPHAGLVRRLNELYAAARPVSRSMEHGRARAEGRPG